MSTITHTNRKQVLAQLAALARDQRRDLCRRCSGSATNPCSRCHKQRQRIVTADANGLSAITIAVQEQLPKARVQQILIEEHDRAARPTREVLAAALEQELIDHGWREDAAEHALWLAEAVRGKPHEVRQATHWLQQLGWTVRSARNILNGTHVPNRALREALQALRGRVAGKHREGSVERRELLTQAALTSRALAARCGLHDDSQLDRLLGLRPESTHTKRLKDGKPRVYGRTTRTAIALEHAVTIAAQLGLNPSEIPGL
jgi:hypothetical protein